MIIIIQRLEFAGIGSDPTVVVGSDQIRSDSVGIVLDHTVLLGQIRSDQILLELYWIASDQVALFWTEPGFSRMGSDRIRSDCAGSTRISSELCIKSKSIWF
jgi:hypothetical protein